MKHLEILYEDNHIIVAVKPENLPVQQDSSGDTDMLTLIKGYIKEKYNKPGNVYLGLVHRLDRPVGGVMVFARTSKAAARLTDSFAKRKNHKKYAAVVCGNAPFKASLECYMRKDAKTFSGEMCDKNADGAKLARLSFTRLCVRDSLSLLDIDLKTGRHHQIRVQLAGEGLPIYGDHRYNEAFINDEGTNIALFAYSLTLEHPITHELMRFSYAPEGGVWDKFAESLSCMKHDAVPVYIDGNIVVCDKQKGVSCAIADADSDTLEERLQRALPYARAVHRLDATTEGLVIYARNDMAYSELIAAFRDKKEGAVRKFYTCRVLGEPDSRSAVLRAYLKKDEEKSFVYIFDSEKAGAKEIVTKYTVKNVYREQGVLLSELEIELITGRTHQIRAHMAHIGHPLVGDDKYGDHEKNRLLKAKTPELRAARLMFDFPKDSKLHYLSGSCIGQE